MMCIYTKTGIHWYENFSSYLNISTLFASFSDCYNVVIFPQVKCHRYWPNTEDQPVVYTERLVYAVSAIAAN